MCLNAARPYIMCVIALLLSLGLCSSVYGEEEGKNVLATRLLDRDVHRAGDTVIGEVDDLIVRRSGRVKKMTMEFGGFLDFGDKLVALSFKEVRLDDGKVFVDTARQRLEKMPAYNYYKHRLRPDFSYSVRPYPRPYRTPPMDPGYYSAPRFPAPSQDPLDRVLSPSRFLISSLLDRRLINQDGKMLGRIQDLEIQPASNTVGKIIVFVEHALGKEMHVALPFKPLGFTPYGVVYEGIQPKELKDFQAQGDFEM